MWRSDMEAGETNGDIAPDDHGDLEDRRRVDERLEPLEDRLLDPQKSYLGGPNPEKKECGTSDHPQ